MCVLHDLPLAMAPPITHWLRRAPLGSGSFGQVSLAVDLDDGLSFAVKSTLCSGSASELSAIETELSILQSLHCPRIISCYGAGFSSENGEPFRNLFLEYMEGGSIAELTKKSGGRLDELRVQCYTRGIVEGLAHLHEKGIVHCDIKGQNILLGSSGVKIADFGAAKKLSEDTCARNYKGTPLWMAPEVIQGVEQGCASDIWSLGCTVVEMLQGRSPWVGESKQNSDLSTSHVAAILFKIGYSQEDVPLPDGISAECRDFLSKALQRDAKLRWSATELLNHVWLRTAPDFESYSAQPSPRSIFDFLSDSDADEHDTCGSITLMIASKPVEEEEKAACREPSNSIDADGWVPKNCEWITVRCADSWVGSRQKPFMTQCVNTTRTSGVNLDSLAFLRRGG